MCGSCRSAPYTRVMSHLGVWPQVWVMAPQAAAGTLRYLRMDLGPITPEPVNGV